MNNEQLAQAIINGEYTERSGDALVRDNDRLENARASYESMVADLEWSYYRQSVHERPSTFEVFIELGLYNDLLTRLQRAITDTHRAQRVLESKKHNVYPWSLVCEDCLHVLTGTYDTWEEADNKRTALTYDLGTAVPEKCVYTLKIMPTHVSQSYTGNF